MSPDVINGLFEFSGGMLMFNNCRVLYKQKMVRGVSKLTTAFFSVWGLWNLFYYPHLGQWWSFAGGVSIVTFNTIWLGLAIYYSRQEWKKTTPSS